MFFSREDINKSIMKQRRGGDLVVPIVRRVGWIPAEVESMNLN